MSKRAEENKFMDSFGKQYGYAGQIDEIRTQEFKRLEDITYLDHSGATQYPESAIRSIYNDFTNNVYGNPHSGNPSSQLSSDILEQVRSRILKHFNTSCKTHTVIFTTGATAALKLLAESFDWQAVFSKESPHRSRFCYLHENHTSVVGIRERAALSGAQVICINEKDLLKQLQFTSEGTEDHLHFKQFDSSGNEDETDDFFVKEYVNCCHNLFAFPAMCNFSGRKYPLEWVSQIQQGSLFTSSHLCHWFVVLDASSFVSTSPLDLNSCTADFVPISFYKIFGFPTGLGALIVKNSSSYILRNCYYGGGTVQATISSERFHVMKNNVAERFEDGTPPFLEIVALHHAFNVFEKLTGSMTAVLNHTHSIALYVYDKMSSMTHNSGKELCKIYCDTDFKDKTRQGPIINFNLQRANGDFVGYSEVEKIASLYNIHLRTGCFCNTGACQKFLRLSNKQVKDNLSAGHVCGDDVDLIEGKPTGSVRISFGYMSNFTDARTFLNFLEECFLDGDISRTEDSLHSHAMLPTKSVLSKHFQDTVTPACHKTSASSDMHSSLEQDLGVCSALEQKDSPATSVNAKRLDNCQVFKSPLPKSIHSLHHLEDLRLEKICIYPIKSCAAFEVNEWEVGHRGFLYDRQWMIVTDSGVCLTQKREPRLCLIKPSLDLSSKILSITAPGMPGLVLPLCLPPGYQEIDASFCQTKVCGDRVCGLDCGDKAASWLSQFLFQNCRLIQHHEEDDRICKLGGERGNGSLSLANESQFLLITMASISELLTSVKQHETTKLPMETELHMDTLIDRFRANLVVYGGKPFSEDHWKTVRIGKLVFRTQGKCNRCQMVCVDQETGKRSVQPMKTLGMLRGSKMPFGVHLEYLTTDWNPPILHCSDVVAVTLDS